MKQHRKFGFMNHVAFLVVLSLVAATLPAQAQSADSQLFDKFNFRADASWLKLNTMIRLDSETLGKGTTLDFENDLELGKNQSIPSLAFEWQIGRKHRLAARWQDMSRDSTAQALTEIQWGDETIPVDASVELAFALTQIAIDYTYYPWVEENWAAGFGLGLRVMDITAQLTWEEGNTSAGGRQAADVTGPLPYINFQYRRMFSENWRFNTHLGWLDVTIGDISGGQWLASASIEYLLGETWGFGAALNYSTIDVDWTGDEFLGHMDFDIDDFSVFVRVRF